ncbi:MAG: hypothetical protein N2Z20_01105 [Elusimicrobiales bacterium]|nr:hypothetical protein [Elusimicrobiales bacterium]MDW7973550.1 hypothetical protein [Thermodesulfovibrio sp.]
MKCPLCGQEIKNEIKDDIQKIKYDDVLLYHIYNIRRKNGESSKKIIYDILSKINISRATFFRKLKRAKEVINNATK